MAARRGGVAALLFALAAIGCSTLVSTQSTDSTTSAACLADSDNRAAAQRIVADCGNLASGVTTTSSGVSVNCPASCTSAYSSLTSDCRNDLVSDSATGDAIKFIFDQCDVPYTGSSGGNSSSSGTNSTSSSNSTATPPPAASSRPPPSTAAAPSTSAPTTRLLPIDAEGPFAGSVSPTTRANAANAPAAAEPAAAEPSTSTSPASSPSSSATAPAPSTSTSASAPAPSGSSPTAASTPASAPAGPSGGAAERSIARVAVGAMLPGLAAAAWALA